MAGITEVSTGYTPRPLQAELHKSLKRFNVICCHRRFGKTVFSLNETLDQALRCTNKSPQYAYIAPTFGQAKRVAWDMLKDIVKNIPHTTINEAELRVDIHRGADRIRIILLGAENPGAIRGIYLDGVILDEFAEMDPIMWSQVIRPALSDRKGWAIFIGTPKGQNGFYDIYQMAVSPENTDRENWFRALYKASTTEVIPLSELEAAKAIMSEEEYEQEYECSFSAALVGAYYGKLMNKAEEEGRVTKVPHEVSQRVFTSWDLGVDDSTAIWFGQQIGKEFRWIDYLEASGEGLDYYAKELAKKPYLYEKHFLPHDIAVRELGTGVARIDTLKSLGLRNIIVVPKQTLEDGINACRLLIPKSWFDAEKCKRGIDALKAYERKWDSKNKIHQQKPLHNWASHGADGFRTAANALDGRKITDEQAKKLPRQSLSNYDIFGG